MKLSAKPRGVQVTFGQYAKKRPQAGAGRSDGKRVVRGSVPRRTETPIARSDGM